MTINLRGTQFRLESSFNWFGEAAATTTFASDRKALDMTVTGACGWIAQSAKTNPVSMASQSTLNLVFYR